MKAWRINELGDPWAHLSIGEVTLPTAPKGVCRIEVEAVDLNFADILQCQGSYQVKLDAELKEIHDSEMWKAGAAVRSLRPENWGK